MERKVWTVSQLAETAGVDGSLVRKLLLAGKLKGTKVTSRLWLIDDDEAQSWLASRKTPALKGTKRGRGPRGIRRE